MQRGRDDQCPGQEQSKKRTQRHRGRFYRAEDNAGEVLCVSISPNGRMLASACGDGTVKVRDLSSGKLHRVLAGHDKAAFAAAFASDHNRIVTASFDGTVRLWNVGTGKQLARLDGDWAGAAGLGTARDVVRGFVDHWDAHRPVLLLCHLCVL